MDESRDVLHIWVGETRVGLLRRGNDGSSFALDDEYLTSGDRPVLGQVFEDAPRKVHRVRSGTPPWFSNLLPEGALRELIAERAGVNIGRSYFLLELMGSDLPGAVVVSREGDSPPDLDDELASADDADQPLKFSLAGVQLKFSGRRSDRGITIPAQGRGGDWIVKLPDQRHGGVPENEFSMMRWAAAAGLDVPEVALIPVNEVDGLPDGVAISESPAYAVKRFDREAGQRVHIEDFAQVLNLPPSDKYGHTNYETIARIVTTLSPSDMSETVRRLVFLVLSGNGDVHAKNWSLIYPDGRTARLSPAYDLVSTVPYIPSDNLGLNLGRTRDFRQIDLDRFVRFAQRAELDVDEVRQIVSDQVERTRSAWAAVRDELPAFVDVKREIDRRLEELPLAIAKRAHTHWPVPGRTDCRRSQRM